MRQIASVTPLSGQPLELSNPHFLTFTLESGPQPTQVPFGEFAGYNTNHLALIVDAVVSTGDRSVFRSPAVEALLIFKWQVTISSLGVNWV